MTKPTEDQRHQRGCDGAGVLPDRLPITADLSRLSIAEFPREQRIKADEILARWAEDDNDDGEG